MRLTLHSIASTDHIALPGLLYEPARASKKVAIWLHGNGGASVFYSAGRMNALGEALTGSGVSFFTFNNRGAEVEKMLKRRKGRTSEYAMLGYALPLTREAGGGAAIDPDARYHYAFDQGARPCAAEPGARWPVVRGATLLALAESRYPDAETAAEAKRLMRDVLDHYLDSRRIESRRIVADLQALDGER